MLDHDRRDLRQLLDLMADRLTHRHVLGVSEAMSAPTPCWPVHDHPIHRPAPQQLPPRALMPRLSALALARPALRPRPLGLRGARRIAGRRPRGIARVLGQLPLQPLHPLGQPPDLTVHPQQHLDHDLPASVVDRLGVGALHIPRFDKAVLCPPDQPNAYTFEEAKRGFGGRIGGRLQEDPPSVTAENGSHLGPIVNRVRAVWRR